MKEQEHEIEILKHSNDKLASMINTFERSINSHLDTIDELRDQLADASSDIADLVVENEILKREGLFLETYLLKRGFTESDVEEFKNELIVHMKTEPVGNE